MKKGIGCIISLIIFLVIITVAIIFGGTYVSKFYNDYKGTSTSEGEDIEIVIAEGSATKDIAKILKENGLINSEIAFILRVKNSEYNGLLRYGTFTLNTGMNVGQMIEVIATGGAKRDSVKFTIPEGYSVEMIANKLENEGICKAKKFLKVVNEEDFDYDFLSEIPNDSQINYRLQGFLFPDTYEFDKDVTAYEIVDRMLARFDEQFDYDGYKKQAKKLGYSVYEIITISSMVEREAKLDEERATIAGVLYNRLKKNMKLQIDATTIYAMSDGLYNVSRVLNKDLKLKSPYNTYYCEALPVGPICNAGIKSIDASFNPESHKYLYYHTDSDGSGKHIFTKTYEEHLETMN